MEVLLAIGVGIGLSSVAGVRAFLPLLLAFVFLPLGFLEASSRPPAVAFVLEVPFAATLGLLAVLALGEIVLDKVGSVERGFNFGMVLVRVASGGLLAAAVAPATGFLVFLLFGAVVAGAVAVLKVVLRPPARATSSGVSASFLSSIEDAVALVGGLVGLFVPFAPVLLVGFLLFFYARIRRRRGRKFGGLRILGD